MSRTRFALRTLSVSLVAGAAAVFLTAAPAAAHTGRGPGGVVDGLLHPITGLDHLLAMLAVGVVAAIAIPFGRAWLAPVAFLGGMLAGGVAGLIDVPLPGAEALIVGSVFVLAAAIVAVVVGERPGVLLTALAIAGVAHGHAHGAEAPAAAQPLVYVGGFLLATAALHLTGMLVGLAVRNREALRLATGAATFASGALLFT